MDSGWCTAYSVFFEKHIFKYIRWGLDGPGADVILTSLTSITSEMLYGWRK